jgi:N-acetylglucosamine-6-sulfatase
MPKKACLLLLCCLLAGCLRPGEAAAAQPNVVLIQTDDQTLQQLYARDSEGNPIMPNVLSKIAGRGVAFNRYYVTYPICCPSRTSLITGLYVHNHGVLINRPPYGYPAFKRSPSYTDNLATWLQGAGYRTIHIGKFLNFYGDADPSEIPPGWTDWETVVSEEGARRYYGETYNMNGALVGPLGSWTEAAVDSPTCRISHPETPGGCNYSTDIDSALAVDAIRRSAEFPQPFYLQVDYTAPHVDLVGPSGPSVATRDEGSATGVRYRPPGFNERDVSDKPRFIRIFHRLSAAQRHEIDQRYRHELESLRAVDTGVGSIIRTLAATRQLGNTYIFFISDNGQFHGEHRIAQGKYLPYEPASHMPLLVAGPGFPRETHSNALVSNTDIAPTIAELARVRVRADGRSLLPYAHDPQLRSRRPILLEGYAIPGKGFFHRHNTASVLDYFGVVAGRYKYVRYGYGGRELYDLGADPAELHSLVGDPRYRPVVQWAQALTTSLKTCKGEACRRGAILVPPPPPKIKAPIRVKTNRQGSESE